MRLPEGLKIVAVGLPGTGTLRKAIANLNASDALTYHVETPEPLDELLEDSVERITAQT